MIPRVLHINTEKTWRGGERQCFFLFNALAKRGAVGWVAARPGYELWNEVQKVEGRLFPCDPWSEWDLLSAWRLARFCRQENIPIVHAHTGHALSMAAWVKRWAPVKVVATRRVDFHLRQNFFSRWKMAQADIVVAISRRVKDVLLEDGVQEKQCRLIPSGVLPPTFEKHSVEKKNFLLSQKGAAGQKIILNVAALVPHKDQATLLRAFAKVRQQVSEVSLWILGEGPLRDSLEKLAHELGVASSVVFWGHQKEVGEFMSLADIFVLSSEEEGLGTALLDALTQGIPSSATRAGGIPDIFGEVSFLAPVHDHDFLAQDMILLLTNHDARHQRIQKGLERARHFTVDNMAQLYIDLYDEVLSTS